MKRLYSILATCLVILAAAACKNTAPVQEEAMLEISKSSLAIPAKGGEASIEFIANNPVKAEVDQDWCTMTMDGDKITITAGDNPELLSRYAKVSITSVGKTVSATVQQFGYQSSGFDPADISTGSAAAAFTFPYIYEDALTATCEADWVTLEVSEDALKVSIAENTTTATKDNKSRTTEIKWQLGIDSGIIKVSQRNTDFMKVDSNWTVTYDGVGKYEDDDAAFITNTVADPAISGKYIIYYEEKATVDAAADMATYIDETLAPAIKEELDYVIALYAALLGQTMTYADFLSEDTHTDAFNVIDPGNYYAFAIGMDDNGEATGHYAFTEFTVTSGGGGDNPPATGYDAWLGEWETVRGTATDTWVITEKEKGSTYTITGIEGKGDQYPVEASYDADTQGLIVRAQTDLGTYTSSSYGECSMMLVGGYNESNFATGTYVIFDGKIEGNKATLNPHEVSFSDGSSNQITRVQYVGKNDEGKYITITKDKTQLPATLTRKGGSNGGGGEGSGDYKKWIGNWNITRGDAKDTWAISELTADKTVSISGIEGDPLKIGGLQAEYSDGKLALKAVPEIMTVSTQYGTAMVSLLAEVHDDSDGEDYIITTGENPYVFSYASLSSDGSADLSAEKVTLSDGNTYTFVDFGFFGKLLDGDYEGAFLSFSKDATLLPNKLTKASSGSSVKTASIEPGSPAAPRFYKSRMAVSVAAHAYEMPAEAHEVIVKSTGRKFKLHR